jgi:hypothetical protein
MKVIIDSSNLMSTTSISKLEMHLRHGDENDAISLLIGSWRGLHNTVKQALEDGDKFSFKHAKLAPYEPTTRQQAIDTIVPAFMQEFHLKRRSITLVEHEKARANHVNACRLHWHLLISWRDPDTGRAYDFSFDYMRQSKVAQLCAFRLGHAPLKTKHNPEIIESLRKDGEHECANWLEAAFPLNARADNASVPLHAVQAAAATGRDLVQTRSVIRMAERRTNTADELKAELAKHDLFIVVGQLSPPAWVVIDQAGVVVGKLAGLAHCTVAKILKRLGEPKHDYNPEQLEPVAAAGPGDGAEIAGVDVGGDGPLYGDGQRPHGRDDLVSDGQVGTDGEEAAAILVAAVNHLDCDAILKLEQRAEHMARGPLLRALEFFEEVISKADGYLEHAAHDMPEVGIYLANLRKILAALLEKLDRAKARFNRWNTQVTIMRHLPKPPWASDREHKQKVRETEENLEKAARNVKRGEKVVADQREFNRAFEDAYDAKAAAHQKDIVEPLVAVAHRRKRVAKRGLALLEDAPEVALLGAPALFMYGLKADIEASPGAIWTVDPSEDDSTGPTFQP